MADKLITDADVIEQIRAALPVVSNEKNGLMSSSKAPGGSLYRIANVQTNNWVRILQGKSVINACSGIISCSNDWNNNASYHVVFIVSAMCRQTSSITVLHRNDQSMKSIDKVRIVKTMNNLYIDVHIIGYLENTYNFSYSGTAFLQALSPTIVPAEQSEYTIEEFDL